MELFKHLTNWKQILEEEQKKDYFIQLWDKVNRFYKITQCYPAKKDIFRAFYLTPFLNTKVIILGQDPYHDGNAEGLAFSCKKSISPSLANINSKIKTSGFTTRSNKSLVTWANQGVLLLNTILTVGEGTAKSHSDFGWEKFTGQCINLIANHNSPKVFILWGKDAQQMWQIWGMDNEFNHVIEAEHPAYASYQKRAWNNNDCFTNTNNFLITKGLKPIKWEE